MVIYFCCCGVLWASPENIAQKLFDDGKYDEALKVYNFLGQQDPNEPTLIYNIANCYYQLNQLDEAKSLYQRVLSLSKDPELIANTKFNLGHFNFQQAANQEQPDLDKTLEILKESASHYRQALRANPEDQAAKKNLMLTRDFMKSSLEVIKKQKEVNELSQQRKKEVQTGIETLFNNQVGLAQACQSYIQYKNSLTDPNALDKKPLQSFVGHQDTMTSNVEMAQNALGGILSQQPEVMNIPYLKNGSEQTIDDPLKPVYAQVHELLKQASEKQKSSSEKLKQESPEESMKSQMEALQHLQQALEILKQNQENEDQENQDENNQNDSQQDQQQGSSSDSNQNQNEDQQVGQDPQQGQEEQQEPQPASAGQPKEGDKEKKPDMTAQEILQKEKERKEKIIFGVRKSPVDKDW